MGFVELFKNQNKRETGLHVGEAFIIWTQLVARYDILEITQFILSHANDTDFKVLVQRGLNNIVMSHIKRLEETMEHYQIPLPPRPPRAIPLQIIWRTQGTNGCSEPFFLPARLHFWYTLKLLT